MLFGVERKEMGDGEGKKVKEKGEGPTDLLLIRTDTGIPVSQTWTHD